MPVFEYKVIPAPRRGEKARGAKTPADRFAHALTQMMNDLGRDGWEYLRADTLPCEERVGLTGKTMAFQHVLVFRRTREEAVAAVQPQTDPLMLPALSAIASEGAAPRIAVVTAPVAIPALGPARDEGVAAE